MSIGFWNINNVRNKLENEFVLEWLHRHDLVVLSETKTAKLAHIPGFIPILAKTENSSRGGVALLVRSYLSSDVYNVDKSVNDQLWFSLTSVPGVRFCGAYITPSTSTYYSEADIANLQAKSMGDAKVVIVGDLNARMGTKVNELVSDTDELSYAPIDSGENENGKKLLSILKDNKMVVVNNLSTSSRNFTSGLTFRMRKIWKSELDLCLMSREIVHTVSHNVRQSRYPVAIQSCTCFG